jgi:diamine N-acetyltransferase
LIRDGSREAGDGLVRLREITPADADELFRWRMDPAARAMFRGTEPVPYGVHLAFLDRYFEPGNDDRWFVIEAAGRPVGAVALYEFAPDGSEAEWGRFVIAPEHRGRGWGRRALVLLLAQARAAGLRRLRCEVLAGNPAERLYRSLGFVDAGPPSVAADGRRFLQLAVDLSSSEEP